MLRGFINNPLCAGKIMLCINYLFRIMLTTALFVSITLFKPTMVEAATTKAQFDNNGENVTVECELVQKGRLRYPPRAKRFNFVGEVTVGFSISQEGKVLDPHVLESSPPGLFEKSALKHVRSWLYNPPQFEGKAVQVSDAKVKIVFRPN